MLDSVYDDDSVVFYDLVDDAVVAPASGSETFKLSYEGFPESSWVL